MSFHEHIKNGMIWINVLYKFAIADSGLTSETISFYKSVIKHLTIKVLSLYV